MRSICGETEGSVVASGFCLIMTPFSRAIVLSQNYKLGKSLENKQHHTKVLLNSSPMNGHTLGFCT